jgi:hypothetical protein
MKIITFTNNNMYTEYMYLLPTNIVIFVDDIIIENNREYYRSSYLSDLEPHDLKKNIIVGKDDDIYIKKYNEKYHNYDRYLYEENLCSRYNLGYEPKNFSYLSNIKNKKNTFQSIS